MMLRMEETSGTRRKPGWPRGWLALSLLALLVAWFGVSQALAQETPESTATPPLPTPQATHEVQGTPALIMIQPQADSVDVGEEFEVEVLVEDVENLGSFNFTIEYDPELVEPVRASDGATTATPGVPTPLAPDDAAAGAAEDIPVRGEAGGLLADSERGGSISCLGPFTREGENQVFVTCVTVDAPFCLGGAAGASGSGLLGRVAFRALEEGTAGFQLTDPTGLILDDIDPCDPEIPRAVGIPDRWDGATVQLAGSDGGFGVLIGVIIGIAAAVVAVAVAGGGFLWFQRRGGSGPA